MSIKFSHITEYVSFHSETVVMTLKYIEAIEYKKAKESIDI